MRKHKKNVVGIRVNYFKHSSYFILFFFIIYLQTKKKVTFLIHEAVKVLKITL